MDKPKVRVVYDEDDYYTGYYAEGNEDGFWGEQKEACEADLGVPYTSENFERDVANQREEDYSEAVDALQCYFDGEKSDISEAFSPCGKNRLLVHGTAERWDGISSGFSPYDNLEELLYSRNSIFKDCEIQKIWDEDGHLFIHGAHHDGSVTVEVRQLTNEGENVFFDWEETFGDFDAAGKHYPAGRKSEIQFLNDFWNNPDFCNVPNYAERSFESKQEQDVDSELER